METSFKKSFSEKENACELLYENLGPCYHLYTPENYEVIFVSEDDFKAGMTIMALCALISPDIRILTFQLMSNHIHSTAAGSEEACVAFFKSFRRRLQLYLKGKGRSLDLAAWDVSLRRTGSLKDLRTIIVYTNRNGFLVNPDETPFSYRWGANRLFFNPDSFALHSRSRERLTVTHIRKTIHSGDYDRMAGLPMVDGYVSPLSFCDVRTAMGLSRDAHHYYHMASRDLESQQMLAKELGESIYYTDNELYTAVVRYVGNKYGSLIPATLPKDAKLETARWMHYEYNAGNKQVSRILRLDRSVVDSMFPSGR